jgi:hypothetical protein
MMKITRQKRGSLFSRESRYIYARGDREIGQLVDPGNDDVFELRIEERPYRLERTRSGIATGFLSGIRNLLNRKATGEFKLVDGSGSEIATARQPGFYEYYILSGQTALNVASGRGQSMARLRVSDRTGAALGEIARGAWKITSRSEWSSSLPNTVNPVLEALLLCLYVMSEKRAENSSGD